ncbi:MAG: glycosyltransferase family 4 protein [Rhizobiales bacterium]|nr:glycosyltransferase family 4 protein [Hyphomicrobiales bacterium]
MSKTILFEGRNLTLKKGTGIATYARNLTAIAKQQGFRAEVVIGTDRPIHRAAASLSEVMLLDAHKAANSPGLQAIKSYVRGLLPVPFGIKTKPVEWSGMVIHPARANLLAEFSTTHAAYDLFEAADQHLIRFGRRAKLNVPSPDLFHATHPTPLMVRGCPNIYTIHDLVPLRLPYATLDKKGLFFDTVKCLARDADHIVTVSEHSRRDIIEFLGIDEKRVTNTYQAVSLPKALTDRPMDEVETDLANIFHLERDGYFLFVGAIEPKKNVAALIDAYVASGSRHPLILAGGLGWQYDEDLAKIEDPRFISYRIVDGTIRTHRQVRHHAYVPLAHLVSLMRGARGVLFPSLYEGFGLPVLEAMALGTPVMTSNVSSLPEIAGDAALLVDPYDRDQMAKAIRSLDGDEGLRADLRQRGQVQAALFSPERYSERIASLYKSVLG